MKNKDVCSVMLLAFLFSLIGRLAWSQTTTAQITGRITDKTGGVIQGADITVANVDTGVKKTTISNEEGYYTVPLLPPGGYRITVQMPGFKPITRFGIKLDVEQVSRLDFVLEVGEVTETIEVSAAAPLIESETSTLGNVRTQKAISELPVNSRNFTHLVHLTAGSVPLNTQSVGSVPITMKRGAPITSVNGLRGEDNNILVEGINNSENHNGLGILIYPPIDALQEFKLQTNSADAQYGRAGGATINVVLKSGGREFHGNLFEFHRNSALDAKNFFAPKGGNNPKFILNQFGATSGGPVLFPGLFNKSREKTFFFFSYEGTRSRQAQNFVSTVPTEAFRGGDFSAHPNTIFDPLTTRPNPQGSGFIRDPFLNNAIPASRLDSVGLNLVRLYPLPNQPGIINNFVFNPLSELDGNNFDFKIDHHLGASDNLTFRYSHGNTKLFEPGALPAPAVGVGSPTGTNRTPHRQFSAGHVHTFAANKTNDFRFGFTRLNLSQKNINFGRDVSSEVGIPGGNTGSLLNSGLSIINVSGFQPLGENGFAPAVIVSENYQWNDNFHYIRGRHSMRMGAEVQRRRYNAFQSFSARGTLNFGVGYTFNPALPQGTGVGLADLLLGVPGGGDIQVIEGTRGFRRTEVGLYFQDDFKVTPKLTFNLGVRYELFSKWPWVEVNDRQSQFLPDLGEIFPVGSPEVPQRSGTETDFNNIAPRLGWAYQLTSKTVLRAGCGFFYNAPQLDVTRNLAGNPPFVGRFSFSNSQFDFPGGRKASQGFERPRVFPTRDSALNAIDVHARTPYVQQWNINIQQALETNMVLTIAYVGTKGTKLVTFPNINQARPGPGAVAARRRWPQFNNISYFSNQAGSIYHSLQLSADKRYSNGMSFLASYSWSHAIDNTSALFGSPQNVLDFNADRGNADFDLRHRFVFSYNYDLPFGQGRRWLRNSSGLTHTLFGGWQVNGIVQLYGGLPFTPTSAINTLNGSGGQRAHLVPGCDPVLPRSERALSRYFNTGCFTTPPSFTFGNAGRNILLGPGTANFDLSLLKNIQFSADQSRYLQFRAEFFNAFNTPHFNNPNAAIGSAEAGSISSVGSLVTFQRMPRQIQFALKFYY